MFLDFEMFEESKKQMNLSPEDQKVFLEFYERSIARIHRLHFRAEMLEIQTKHLRELCRDMTKRISGPEVSDSEYDYWSEKIDQYTIQSSGMSSLITIYTDQAKSILEDVFAQAGKYGIELSANTTGQFEFPEFINFPDENDEA